MKVMLYACLLITSLSLSACGGKGKPYIENPYENQMKDFTHIGVNAMHEERWKSAEQAFSRALQMAQLLSDPALEARAWYNDAMAWKGMGNIVKAKHALQQGLQISQQYGLFNSGKRAQVQWVILQDGKGELPKLEANLPSDIALSLAYILAKKKEFYTAEQAYQHVLRHTDDEKSGLLLQARAMLGLAALPADFKAMQDTPWLKQALKLFRQVGAPKKTAQTLMMIASSQRYPVEQRRDAAHRAETIYHILQDKRGEALAKESLQGMALLEGGEHE